MPISKLLEPSQNKTNSIEISKTETFNPELLKVSNKLDMECSKVETFNPYK